MAVNWPDWTPPPEMMSSVSCSLILPGVMAAATGPSRSAPARCISAATVYRIHGTNARNGSWSQRLSSSAASGWFNSDVRRPL